MPWKANPGAQQLFLSCPAHQVLFAGTRGNGKGQPLDEPVMTPSGWREIGALVVGDQVINRKGTPSIVTEIHDLGNKEIFRCTFSDGRSTRATDDHLWSISIGSTQKTYMVRNTVQIGEALEWGVVITLPTLAPPDLYGFKGSERIFDKDELRRASMIARDAMAGKDVQWDARWTLTTVGNRLRIVDAVMSQWSFRKHPRYSSRLLPSLPRIYGQYFQDHIRSLGGRCSELPGPAFSSISLLVHLPTSNAHNVLVQTELPYLFEWKRCIRLASRICFSKIEHLGEAPARCIKIDHPEGLYIANQWVVTHNTDALLMSFLQQVGKGYGPFWRGVLFRRSYKQLDDVVNRTKRWFYDLAPGARWLSGKDNYRWIFPEGEELMLRHMENESNYENLHGHELSFIGYDELSTWPTQDAYRMMLSCSRSSGPPEMPRIVRATTNPWGVGRGWVKEYFVDRGEIGAVHKDYEGNTICCVSGHWSENDYLIRNDPQYISRLRSDTNEGRKRAWLEGDWNVSVGSFFADHFKPSVHVMYPFDIPSDWYINRSFDWGSSKPFSVLWWAEATGSPIRLGQSEYHIPRGTLFMIREWYGWNGKPNHGLKMPTFQIAQGIAAHEKDWGLTGRVRKGPADPAIFSGDPDREKSIAGELESYGVKFHRANNNRVQGWEMMKTLLDNAMNNPGEMPGLYIFNHCPLFIDHVSNAVADERNLDDMSTEQEDHDLDAARYRCAERIAVNFSGTYYRPR